MHDIVVFLQHHLGLSAALLAVVLVIVLLEFIKLKQAARSISPTQLVQLINHQDAVVIDTRSKDAFDSGHIVNALSIPAAELTPPYQKLEKFKSKPIVLLCAQGIDSQRLATLLKDQGFQANALAGGLRGWKDADMPTVKK